jgi:hypothetical protein
VVASQRVSAVPGCIRHTRNTTQDVQLLDDDIGLAPVQCAVSAPYQSKQHTIPKESSNRRRPEQGCEEEENKRATPIGVAPTEMLLFALVLSGEVALHDRKMI